MVRMVVDNDLCGDAPMDVPVPYVVSFPQWLVAPQIPEHPRTTWLFFRGHLPKSYIDRTQVSGPGTRAGGRRSAYWVPP